MCCLVIRSNAHNDFSCRAGCSSTSIVISTQTIGHPKRRGTLSRLGLFVFISILLFRPTPLQDPLCSQCRRGPQHTLWSWRYLGLHMKAERCAVHLRPGRHTSLKPAASDPCRHCCPKHTRPYPAGRSLLPGPHMELSMHSERQTSLHHLLNTPEPKPCPRAVLTKSLELAASAARSARSNATRCTPGVGTAPSMACRATLRIRT